MPKVLLMRKKIKEGRWNAQTGELHRPTGERQTLTDKLVQSVVYILRNSGQDPPQEEIDIARDSLLRCTNEELQSLVTSVDKLMAAESDSGSRGARAKRAAAAAWKTLIERVPDKTSDGEGAKIRYGSAAGFKHEAEPFEEAFKMTPAQAWEAGKRSTGYLNPDPTSRYKSDRDFADDCVRLFLACSESLIAQVRGDVSGHDGINASRAQQNARRAWTGMQRARLFMVRPETWMSLHRVADQFTEAAVGNDWTAYDQAYDPSNPADIKSTARLMDFYANEGPSWPFPDPMPFEACFFCYGSRLGLSGSALHTRLRDAVLTNGRDVRLAGNLLVWEGDQPYAFTFLIINEIDSDKNIGLLVSYDDEEWFQPMSLDPWILGSLVRQINSHRSITQEYAPTLANRMDRKKAQKQAKQALPLPAPYYMINLKDELITPQQMAQRRIGKTGRLIEWSHRWDVRGHEAVRFEHGLSPIDPKHRAKLVKRGYRVYEDGKPLSEQDSERLTKRGVPLALVQSRERTPEYWIAVLSYWQPACVKGPEHKPYVPGARI